MQRFARVSSMVQRRSGTGSPASRTSRARLSMAVGVMALAAVATACPPEGGGGSTTTTTEPTSTSTSTSTSTTSTSTTTTTTIPTPPPVWGWGYDPRSWGLDVIGESYTVSCTPGGFTAYVWGSFVYTSDSSVCNAAVYEGRITFADGGTVTFRIDPGQESYTSGSANGVTTVAYGSWPKSFVFVD